MWYLKANATESLDLPDSAYYDGAQTDRALEELAALKGRQPFFFAIGYYRPHLPFNAPRRYWNLYDPDSIALAPNPDLPKDAPPVAGSNLAELRGYADFATAPEPWEGRLSEADARRLKHGYYASVSYMVTQCHRPEERNKVQSFNDFLVFGSMAIGSFSSGALLVNFGWAAVNEVVFPVVLTAAALLAWGTARERARIA